MSGVFKYPSTLKPEAYKRLKNDLIAQSTGLHNAHTPLLLEGGMTYERISIPPEDAQFIATRKFQKTEIATIYGANPDIHFQPNGIYLEYHLNLQICKT